MVRSAISLLLCACYALPPGTMRLPSGAPEVAAVLDAYAEHIGDPGPTCRSMLDMLHVVIVDDTEPLCLADVLECYTHRDGMQVRATRRDAIIVVNARLPENRRRRAIVHGLFHWLEECDGRSEWFHTRRAPYVYAPGWREAEQAAQERLGI